MKGFNSSTRIKIYLCATTPLKACAWGHEWLPGFAYSREIDSAQYDTLGRLTCQDMIPRWARLTRVCDPGEILLKIWSHDSLENDIQGACLCAVWYPATVSLEVTFWLIFLLTRWGMILWQVMFFYSIFRKNLIVLSVVSFESDEIETSIFSKM